MACLCSPELAGCLRGCTLNHCVVRQYVWSRRKEWQTKLGHWRESVCVFCFVFFLAACTPSAEVPFSLCVTYWVCKSFPAVDRSLSGSCMSVCVYSWHWMNAGCKLLCGQIQYPTQCLHQQTQTVQGTFKHLWSDKSGGIWHQPDFTHFRSTSFSLVKMLLNGSYPGNVLLII